MSELTSLRQAVDDLAARAPLPDFGDLGRRADRRGRRRVGLAAAACAAVVTGAALALPALDHRPATPAEAPTTSSSPSPTEHDRDGEPPTSVASFDKKLNDVFAQATGWSISDGFPQDYEYVFVPSPSNGNGRCSGGLDDWGRGSLGGGDGGMGPAGYGSLRFATEAQASRAAARLVENLESCTATDWRTRPIPRTGAVLAHYADAVTWIQQTGLHVDVLQVATTDGPPPLSVQVEVAEWMVAFRTWSDQDR